jgi:hypothetical protein
LFGPLNEFLGSKRFQDYNEVIEAVRSWIDQQPESFFEIELRSFQYVGTNALPLMGDFIGK